MSSPPTRARTHARQLGAGASRPVALDARDALRLALAMRQAGRAASGDVSDLLPPLGPFARAALRRSCAYAHDALLLFPTTLAGALEHFSARGLDPVQPVASVLVRRRLCARYGLAHDACDVSLTRLRTSPAAGRNLEVFLFPRTAAALRPEIVLRERRQRFEDHVALEVGRPDEPTLDRLMTLLRDDAGLLFEGGGHNPHEGAGGSTVLYFLAQNARSQAGEPRYKRVELCCAGDFSAMLGRHGVDRRAVADAYSRWSDVEQPPAARAA